MHSIFNVMKTNTLILALAMVCSSISVFAQTQILRGPYLQSPTTSSIKIKWRTDVPTTSSITVSLPAGGFSQTYGDSTLTTDHTVLASGLTANTTYEYTVNAPGNVLSGPDYRFRTFLPASPTETTPFRVWGIGDFGKGNNEQKKVRDAFLNYTANNRPAFWVWLGDNAYPDGTDQQYQDYVFDGVHGYKNIMTWLPFLPAPGNHDYNSVSPIQSSQPPLQHNGPYYQMVDVYKNGEAGGVPSGHELFYSYDYGNVHFVSLNSELGSLYNSSHDWIGVNLFSSFNGSPMTQWLHQDLAANTLPWTVVYFHQPPHSDGSHDSEAFWEVYMKAMRENFTPILEQYGVDLVLCGHSHVYERSYLMKGLHGNLSTFNPSMILQSTGGSDATGGNYVKYTDGPNPNQGTVYVVNGNSGSKETDPNLQHPAMFTGYGCDTCIGSLILDFSGNRVDGYHIDGNGVERDHFVIEKKQYPLSVNEAKKDVLQWSVAPNPFTGETVLKYTLTNDAQTEIFLTDMNGKRYPLMNEMKTQGEYTFTINADKLQLAVGAYTLFISTNGKTVAKTIMKM